MVALGAVTALLERLVDVATAEAPPLLEPGVRAGRYEIIRAIGRGGFGSVYEAHDTVLHRLVALKVLHRPQVAGPAAAREGEAAAQLAHPNIAALHDAGIVDGGYAYLVYEILHGETLESRLSRGPLPPAEAVAIGVQVARALTYAHEHGVVHRDLKPANVFLTVDGEVKVLDFGMALLFGRDAPAGGTPAYMAPEQRRGEPEDARTDLFALGLLLVEMSTGERNRNGGAAPARVPPPIRRVVTALLAEDRALRPRSARAALLGLEAAARRLAPRQPPSWRHVAATAAALAVAATVVIAAIVRGRLERGPAVAEASVAVLPFTDLSPQRDQEYFSAGLAEEILDALAQVRGLRVAGRISSFALKREEDDLRTIGQKLGVRAVLEGSVRKSGERVRITAQLVEVRGGYELWSRTFDRELRDVFAVQDEIAKAVVDALQVKLLASDEPTTKAQRTSSPEAHTQYLLGRQLYARHTADGYRRAAEAYEKSIALDAGYAAAHAWLALALRDVAADEPASAAVLRRRAMSEAERAVVLGPDLPDAFAARGFLRIAWTHDWAGARADLARAIALNPSDSPARRRQGILLAALGRAATAATVLRQAIDLDPLDSTTWSVLGSVETYLGRFDAARDALRRALEISPASDDALIIRGYCDIVEGRPADALTGTRRVREMERLEIRSMAERDLGRAAEARRDLDQLIARYGHSDAGGIAQVYAWWDDRDHAFEWLDRALGQELFDVKFNPFLRKLRPDPRFAALLRRMDLPPD